MHKASLWLWDFERQIIMTMNGVLAILRLSVLILIIVNWSNCRAQSFYQSNLSSKIHKIRELDSFDNTILVMDDTLCGAGSFPRWSSVDTYYEEDIVTHKNGATYRAITDNK